MLITTLFVLAKIYKDEISNYVISEINKEIEVKISIRSADISVIRKFPYVSIVLNDVVALSGNDFNKQQFKSYSADTLFTASRIYLQFNITDILRKEYRLKKVHAVNGKINILIDKSGRVNYRIFKQTGTDKDNNVFTFSLDGVKISNFSWNFINFAKDIYSLGVLREITLKGRFSQHSFSLNTITTLHISTFRREGIEYASDIKIGARLILNVQDSVYTISRGDLALNDLDFNTTGSFILGKQSFVDLQIAGINLNVSSLLIALPFNTSTIKKYSPSGKIDILTKINGVLNRTMVPSVKAAFKLTDGKIILPGKTNNVTGIFIKGSFTNGALRNGNSSRINLTDFSGLYGNSKLTGKLSIDNFINPFLSASVTGTIFSVDISEIAGLDGLDLKTGYIYPDVSVNLNLGSFETFTMDRITGKEFSGNLIFKDISGTIPIPGLPLNSLNGTVKMDGEIWLLDFATKLGRSIFSANLVVNHFWEYFVNHSNPLGISGEIYSEYLKIQDFVNLSDSTEATELQMPDSIYLKLYFNVDSLEYGKFSANSLETNLTYKPGFLNVSSAIMNSMKGKVFGKGAFIEDTNGLIVFRCSGEIRKIDIFKLFDTFNNFGQDFIVAENLRGIVSGKFDFSSHINQRLELLTNDLSAESDFIIENGELINFEPITELSSFVELSELQHIKFSTLKNSILIKDEKVFIPQMEINSSAFNITVSGTHGFDNYFEYKLRLNLNEILAGKIKRTKDENLEFGIIEDDGTGNTNLYLSVTGTPDDYKIRYDRKEAMNKIKTDLQEEKKLLRTILKEELGLFKKDTVLSTVKKAEEDHFILDWGEETKTPGDSLKPKKDKKNKKKTPEFEISWEEDDSDIK